MLIFLILISYIFLCWGSFLNVVAYRSITDISFWQKRSICPNCKKVIFWYDNIPIVSWIILKAKCRNCKIQISWLYPFIEILTTVIMTALFCKIFNFNLQNNLVFNFYLQDILNFFAYFIFFSVLIIATRTDLQDLVIPQIFSIYLVPIGLIFSYFNLIKISFLQSILGAIFGYLILWITAKLFKYFAQKEGLGVGDMELLALIGAFLGPIGVWATLLLGSVIGLIIGIFYILITKQDKSVMIPFGPFLALGATIYFFFENLA
ncbi:prepilin peptidase [Candidatus Babeliales bacterium]|nr:prepilin peptidase [Candidatus Babeliales bacterium]MCF7899661.1 prepilin peptidase [Candidatus Babeliales bacterium]